MLPDSSCVIVACMNASMLDDSSLSMPIDGIPWSWRPLGESELRPLLPFVMAADPSGAEAVRWPSEAIAWLAEDRCRRGLVGVQCLAGLTLAFFFYALSDEGRGVRQLIVERLRWLELARPHRSLDAVLTILIETARQLDCTNVLLKAQAASELNARRVLADRAEATGFIRGSDGWHQPTGRDHLG
jgi:hypothetical protein